MTDSKGQSPSGAATPRRGRRPKPASFGDNIFPGREDGAAALDSPAPPDEVKPASAAADAPGPPKRNHRASAAERSAATPPTDGAARKTSASRRAANAAPADTADDSEPLSLAEQLVEEAERGDSNEDPYDRLKQSEVHIAELQKLSMSQLIDEARRDNVTDVAGMKKQDIIFRILKERVKMNGLMYGEGTLEILPDGFGFLRSPDYHYLSCPDDIYV
ncbi:MAG: Rho termination factor N-terminal domain-containing protein, partial [Planctomycetales bacterium]|nr:Rho termination factor N-terminal domain-containing protein [Planctomycetales bacterium]